MATGAKRSRKSKTKEQRERNIDILKRYIELENKRDYKNIEELFHPTRYTCPTWFGSSPISPKAHTRMLRGLFKAYPDWRMTINQIISADDYSVSALITGRGTQHGTFMGLQPSHNQIAIPLVHTIRIEDGKIIEYRSTNPFEDPFRAEIVGPEDVQAVRAQQGIDTDLSQSILREVEGKARLTGARIEQLSSKFDPGQTQCQALLDKNLRRCVMQAIEGSIYCEHHQKHGYGAAED